MNLSPDEGQPKMRNTTHLEEDYGKIAY